MRIRQYYEGLQDLVEFPTLGFADFNQDSQTVWTAAYTHGAHEKGVERGMAP